MSLKTVYKEKIINNLRKSLGLTNPLAVPRVEKVVVNVGVGKTLKDPKMLESIIEDLKQITGQAPVKTLAKKSVSGFKIREGQVVGLMVTLRGDRMYDFLEKLVKISIPRVRDFRGLDPKKFDRHGNYNIGFREQIVFPETTREHMDYTFGLEVNIQTNTNNDHKALELLKSLGFPFMKE
ncbi:MAG: 50S ribosomal protein L5 [Candidatus Doudnabacteria bacterium RIFCSPLOWO2_01_FULL_44_21]|uniref:Large ribosomal subunit protein uL5 n=1 Tax=Candidatus Doudnabacteria bacterium RIFCSPLOWO2_01_FULL_44_21 TaxID=1817841 RepID=A0A1F5PY80_9BACT|nr:ribosomal protein L5 [uncultured bacterium]OGE83557.1 MAG: 50S ribosomal protein L5 [Candidatus Doudnabacteria bacterium RIFCSPHIGHO2_02_FULL_43_13b]OGE94797.1 MAG: 50S ribosomal protein L5 [Candidatus Doudnabacteria bacterium RIFCSPLOWO2_01_FULL_44_21]